MAKKHFIELNAEVFENWMDDLEETAHVFEFVLGLEALIPSQEAYKVQSTLSVVSRALASQIEAGRSWSMKDGG